ncbi:MAG: hypothetical protein PQ612_05175 [Rickettsiales bacterium]|nr:hypothetical protein [Pseudomonadota bacterium]MDG4543273.1 hypothetical protein [Rickettsiales bacterium]MDG4545539.1 hypothetical protein [Rickettsiales bacterium]MDG4547988.1 hypothetical protein [Rickettsiales bacterium]
MLAFYFTPKEKTEYTEYLKSRVGKVMIVDEGGLKKDSYGKIRNQEQSNTDDFHKMSKWDRLSYFASISYDNNVDFIKEGEKVVVVSVREKDKCLMCKNSS